MNIDEMDENERKVKAGRFDPFTFVHLLIDSGQRFDTCVQKPVASHLVIIIQ